MSSNFISLPGPRRSGRTTMLQDLLHMEAEQNPLGRLAICSGIGPSRAREILLDMEALYGRTYPNVEVVTPSLFRHGRGRPWLIDAVFVDDFDLLRADEQRFLEFHAASCPHQIMYAVMTSNTLRLDTFIQLLDVGEELNGERAL